MSDNPRVFALYKEYKRLLQITHLIVADSFFANGLFAKGLESICKVVIVDFIDTDKKKQIRKVYFSTDRTLSGQDIFDLYRTRFQIEFLYRSGKGLTAKLAMSMRWTSLSICLCQP